MPPAAGHIASNSEGCGSFSAGKPPWIAPTTLTPKPSRPMRAEVAIPMATASSGAGAFGRKRLESAMIASVAKATMSVGQEMALRCAAIDATSRKKPALWM